MKPMEVVLLPDGVDWRFDFQQRLVREAYGPGSLMEQAVERIVNRSSVRGWPRLDGPGYFVPREFVACDVSGRKELFRAPLVHDSGALYRAVGVCKVSGELGECFVEGEDVGGAFDKAFGEQGRVRYSIKIAGLPKFLNFGEKVMIQVDVP